MLYRTALLLKKAAAKAPVKKMGAYMFFVRSNFAKAKGASATEKVKALGASWNKLSAAEKKKYADSAPAAKPRKVRATSGDKPKVKRAPTPLSKYVKANYDSVRHLPVNERFAALAKAFKASKQ